MENSFPNPVYVDKILFVTSDVNLLKKNKLLSSRFNKKVLGEMSLVIRIQTHRDIRKEILGLSHRHAKKSF
jgi:predicted kinase